MSALGGWSGAGGWGGAGGWSGAGGWGGWNGAGAQGGWSAAPADANPLLSTALIQSRGALAGPFQGPAIKVPWPALNDPKRLAEWDVGPRMEICQLELMAGLEFTIASRDTVELGYAAATRARPGINQFVSLTRPPLGLLQKQLWLVANYAELRADRGSEVLAQTVPQVPFWSSIIGLTAYRHKYTTELIGLMLSLASHVEMRFKHEFACPRPVVLSPQIQPMIATPGHGSWPSGHATEAFAVAAMLQALLPQGAAYQEQLERQAARIAVNRTVAGLHYPVDTAAGRLLGTALAEFLVARCHGDTVHLRGFDGPRFEHPGGAALDFDLRVSLTNNKSGFYQYGPAVGGIPVSPLLAFMWAQARKEW